MRFRLDLRRSHDVEEPARDDEPIVPDGIEPIVAYRAWHLGRPDGSGQLRSIALSTAWSTDGWTEARCHRPDVRRHAAPEPGCTCGLYAMRDVGQLTSELSLVRTLRPQLPPPIVGKVELAGKIVEHDMGFRAERGRLVEVLPLPGQREIAERVAETYHARVGEEIAAPDSLSPTSYTGKIAPRARTLRSQLLVAAFVVVWLAAAAFAVFTGHPASAVIPVVWGLSRVSGFVAAGRGSPGTRMFGSFRRKG